MKSLTFAAGQLSVEFTDDIARIALDRPGQRNAIGEAIWRALPDAIAAAVDAPDVRVVVLEGRHCHFAAGADITEFDRVFGDRIAAAAYRDRMAAALAAIADCAKPTIASIRGNCIGAGVSIALACDLRMAASDATFGVTPARLGLLYSLGDTRRLVIAVGAARARELLFTGSLVDADTAERWGLVGTVCDPSALDGVVSQRAASIAARSPWSIRHAKRVVARVLAGQSEDDEITKEWFVDAVETDDYREGLAAFKTKRPARFSGS